MSPRHTGRGIVVRGTQILLMERWRAGLHYFSIPGGGIEAGETPQQCAVREILEETTVAATAGREVLQMHDGDIGRLPSHCCHCQLGIIRSTPGEGHGVHRDVRAILGEVA